MGDGMGGFEGGDDAFHFGQRAEGREGFGVGGVVVIDAAGIAVVAVLGPDGGVVEAGGDGVGELDLAVGVGEEPGFGALEDSEFAALETCGVAASHDAVTSGFDAGHFHRFITQEGIKETDRIASAAHAGDEEVWQAFLALEDLAAGFITDHSVKIPNDHRIRVRTQRAAEDVVGVPDIRHPVAHGFVDGFFERGLAGGDADDFRSEKTHASDIEGLPLHVHRAHVDRALEAEARGGRGSGDAVLAGTGLRDDAGFPHAAGEEDLADRVVDLVRAGVEEVFALQINFRAAEFFGEPFGKIEGRWASAKIREQPCEFLPEFRILAGGVVFALEVLQRRHERFGNEHASIGAEVAARVGQVDRGAVAHEVNVASFVMPCNPRTASGCRNPASFLQRLNAQEDLVFVKLVPFLDGALDPSGPILIADGAGDIEAVAHSENVGDHVNRQP